MRKNKLRLRNCGKIIAVVLLMNFCKFPMYAEPPTEQLPNSSEKETRLYGQFSDAELPSKNAKHFYTQEDVDFLVDTLSEAALEAIEQAAGEAAKAAVLSVLEREALALREAEQWRIQADINALAFKEAKKQGVKNTIIGVLLGIVGGFFVGFAISK